MQSRSVLNILVHLSLALVLIAEVKTLGQRATAPSGVAENTFGSVSLDTGKRVLAFYYNTTTGTASPILSKVTGYIGTSVTAALMTR
jgi:hypothetical protein